MSSDFNSGLDIGMLASSGIWALGDALVYNDVSLPPLMLAVSAFIMILFGPFTEKHRYNDNSSIPPHKRKFIK